jgi:cytochrome b
MSTIVKVWDWPTRLFHWLLVVAVVGMFITGEIGGNAMVWHGRLGYGVLALLLFRVVWGLVGGHYSRFTSFVPTPARLMAYVRGTAPKALGHNPLGALSVLALLGLLLLQTSTGLFADDEIAYSGPLTSLISNAWVSIASKWHKDIGKALLIVMVLLHVGAILFYLFKRQENLIEPMLTGVREMDILPVYHQPRILNEVKQSILAAVIMIACSALVWWIVSLGAKT